MGPTFQTLSFPSTCELMQKGPDRVPAQRRHTRSTLRPVRLVQIRVHIESQRHPFTAHLSSDQTIDQFSSALLGRIRNILAGDYLHLVWEGHTLTDHESSPNESLLSQFPGLVGDQDKPETIKVFVQRNANKES